MELIFQGKTDVAMLTILRVFDQHRLPTNPSSPLHTSINRNAFQIIYVWVSDTIFLTVRHNNICQNLVHLWKLWLLRSFESWGKDYSGSLYRSRNWQGWEFFPIHAPSDNVSRRWHATDKGWDCRNPNHSHYARKMGRRNSKTHWRGRVGFSMSLYSFLFFNPPDCLCIQKLKLLIIDEVHLLNEERGAVIETIVARTLRQVHVYSLRDEFDG